MTIRSELQAAAETRALTAALVADAAGEADPAWARWPWRTGQGHLWCLTGPAGAGKSLAAKALLEGGWRREAFAEPIRAAVLALYPGWGVGHFEQPLKELKCPRHGIAPRSALRTVGEHARELDAEIYVRAMARRLGRLVDAGFKHVVIDDLRLPLEARLVRDLGGRVIHIARPGVDYRQDCVTEMGGLWQAGDAEVVNRQDAAAWWARWLGLAGYPQRLGLEDEALWRDARGA